MPGFEAISIRKAISLRGVRVLVAGIVLPRSIFITPAWFKPRGRCRCRACDKRGSLLGPSPVTRSLPIEVLLVEKQIKPAGSASLLPPATAAPEVT